MAKNNSLLDIKSILNEYSNDIQDGITEAAFKVVEDGKNKLKVTSPKRVKGGGAYRKGWRVAKRSGKGYVHATIYNATHPQLTHLLERPHAIRNQYGSWGTYDPQKSGTVHIEPVEKECNQSFRKDVEQVIKNGG